MQNMWDKVHTAVLYIATLNAAVCTGQKLHERKFKFFLISLLNFKRSLFFRSFSNMALGWRWVIIF